MGRPWLPPPCQMLASGSTLYSLPSCSVSFACSTHLQALLGLLCCHQLRLQRRLRRGTSLQPSTQRRNLLPERRRTALGVGQPAPHALQFPQGRFAFGLRVGAGIIGAGPQRLQLLAQCRRLRPRRLQLRRCGVQGAVPGAELLEHRLQSPPQLVPLRGCL